MTRNWKGETQEERNMWKEEFLWYYTSPSLLYIFTNFDDMKKKNLIPQDHLSRRWVSTGREPVLFLLAPLSYSRAADDIFCL